MSSLRGPDFGEISENQSPEEIAAQVEAAFQEEIQVGDICRVKKDWLSGRFPSPGQLIRITEVDTTTTFSGYRGRFRAYPLTPRNEEQRQWNERNSFSGVLDDIEKI